MIRWLTLLFILSAISGRAQTYTYKPLNLDTTCYWLSDYHLYEAGWLCRGEGLSYVAGDTMIKARKFMKIVTYPTDLDSASCTSIFYGRPEGIVFLREDTIAKAIYNPDSSYFLDFNLKVGDTLHVSFNYFNPVVDSITFQTINGLNRRIQWFHSRMHPIYTFKTIEGIGMNYNFPASEFGEWGIPSYTLKCYSKGGQMMYSNGSVTSCPKKPRWTLAVPKEPILDKAAFSTAGNSIRILNAALLPMNMQIWDMTGRMLRTYAVSTTAPISMDLVPGNYVLRLYRKESAAAFLVNLQP